MPAVPRHSKPKTPATRLGAPVVAAATLSSVAAAFVFLHSGSAAPRPSRYATPVTTAASGFTTDQVMADVHRTVAARMVSGAATAAQRQQWLHADTEENWRAFSQVLSGHPAAAAPKPSPASP